MCWKRGSVRLGSLSHYPLKREWDQLRWGLSWQTFPVALSIDGCLWAFPQWHVSWQNGAERFHPARVKSDGYLRNALVPEDPCFTGETLASQEGAVCSIQRRLPEWHPSWVGASDSWVFVLTAKVEPVIYTTGGESVLELSIGTTSVKLHCRSPEGCVPKLSILEDGLSLRWELPIAREFIGQPVIWRIQVSE
ncbi:MAG: hypothetical protein LR015_11755 [Verrucomicrobia bacterium]|nr:hypothetical protein [Verrucomicrobiota bacterium]